MLMTQPIQKLIDSRDFQNIARNAKRWTGSCFVIQARIAADPHAPFRFGLTASRKVGNAVVRNRCKRRLREAARAMVSEYGVPGSDYVFIARQGTADRPWERLLDDVKSALTRLATPADGQKSVRPAPISPDTTLQDR